jgi:hypothetical protein
MVMNRKMPTPAMNQVQADQPADSRYTDQAVPAQAFIIYQRRKVK